MNLKQAATAIGVHYQTAYKWVRSGELVAVRIGGRYEVSEAAIERFQSRRAALSSSDLPADTGMHPVEGPEHALEELEAMIIEPFIGVNVVARFVARRVAEVLGGVCNVTLSGKDGNLMCQAIDHPNPAYAALIGGFMETLGPAALRPGTVFSARGQKGVVRLDHVPQDLFRDHIRAEMHQHLGLYPVRCLLSVPVTVDGETHGAITSTRSEADRPHSDDDETFVREIAERVGRLVATAQDAMAAAQVRADLTRGLSQLVEDPEGEVSRAGIVGLFDRVTKHVGLTACVLDRDRVIVAANPTFERMRAGEGNSVGSVFEAVTHPDDRDGDRASFERLASGELDYLDVIHRRQQPSGELVTYMSHRAAVRAADASLRYFVSVARVIRVCPDVPPVPQLRSFRSRPELVTAFI